MAASSAGILLFRRAGEALEVLLVHPGGPYWAKKDLGAWSIPKGLVEGGEDSLACALRELEEELGSSFSFAAEELIELGSVRQKAGKLVHCWAAEGDFDPAALRRTPSASSGRHAPAASKSSPRSTGPSGSGSSRRGTRSSPRRLNFSIG